MAVCTTGRQGIAISYHSSSEFRDCGTDCSENYLRSKDGLMGLINVYNHRFKILVQLNGITLSLPPTISWVQLPSSSFSCLSRYVKTFNTREMYPLGIRMYSFEICIPFECDHPEYVTFPNMYRRNMYISHTTFTYFM